MDREEGEAKREKKAFVFFPVSILCNLASPMFEQQNTWAKFEGSQHYNPGVFVPYLLRCGLKRFTCFPRFVLPRLWTFKKTQNWRWEILGQKLDFEIIGTEKEIRFQSHVISLGKTLPKNSCKSISVMENGKKISVVV